MSQTLSNSRSLNMIEALREAQDIMLERDEDVVIYGQDAGYFGGVFRVTAGLQEKYGTSRVFDAPISEGGIVGTAIGMAAYGLKPCVEIQFADYIFPAYDQITQEAARIRYRSNGQFTCPMVIRTPTGGGIFGGRWAVRSRCKGIRSPPMMRPTCVVWAVQLMRAVVGRREPGSMRRR